MLRQIVRRLSAAGLSFLLLTGIWAALPSAAQAVSLTAFQQGDVLLADAATVTEVKPSVEKALVETATEEAEEAAKAEKKAAKQAAKEAKKLAKAEAKQAKELAKAEAKKVKETAKAEAKQAKELAKAEAKQAKEIGKAEAAIESAP